MIHAGIIFGPGFETKVFNFGLPSTMIKIYFREKQLSGRKQKTKKGFQEEAYTISDSQALAYQAMGEIISHQAR